jgi:hypothetical protein
MTRLVLAMAFAYGCSGDADDGQGDAAGPVLRVVATLSGGDLEACSHIWNAGFEVTVGPVVLNSSNAVGRDGEVGQWFRDDYAWPAEVNAGDAGEASFDGDGEAMTRAAGSAAFTATPGSFQLIELVATCAFELDAGP